MGRDRERPRSGPEFIWPQLGFARERKMYGMRVVRSLVVAVLAFVVVAVPSVALADGRVALVVGNSTYAHIGRLPNPENDAADMSEALRRLGFEVTTELDADRVELTAALRAFTRRSAGADVSLVFYAGHGIEMDGVNYLVPVDARLERGLFGSRTRGAIRQWQAEQGMPATGYLTAAQIEALEGGGGSQMQASVTGTRVVDGR